MRNYVGTKIIKAELTNLAEYKIRKYKELALVVDGDASIEGYIVFYPPIGGGTDLYLSWSPKEVFEKAYREIDQSEIDLLKMDCFK